MRWLWWSTALSVLTLLVSSTLALVYVADHRSRSRSLRSAVAAQPPAVSATESAALTPPTSTAPQASTLPAATDIPTGPVPRAGCPPPPRGRVPQRTPWRPAVLVPDEALPEPAAPPADKVEDLTALAGKGMWIWQWTKTEGGRLADVVERARTAGLETLWVRVGDTRNGFYGGSLLDELVPAAHAAGLSVAAWGFPNLYDPAVDVAWTSEVLRWRGPGGERVDAFSPDLEMGSEGTAVSKKRLAVYLGAVRSLMAGRPLVATVYPPTSRWRARYPYATVGAYVDATAPMEYWGCREPGEAAAEGVKHLLAFGAVLPIGQAYDMGPEGGRQGAPSRAETLRFMDVAKRSGALGVSFWSWQHIDDEQWGAVAAFAW